MPRLVTVATSNKLSELAWSLQSPTALPGEILTHFWNTDKAISDKSRQKVFSEHLNDIYRMAK